jgi:hypothetical protein
LPPPKTFHSPLHLEESADIDFDSKAIVLQHGISQKQTVNEVFMKPWFLLQEYAWPHYTMVMSELWLLAHL